MASNFFARQDRARSNTAWLVTLFLIAVFGIVAATSAFAYLAIIYLNSGKSKLSPDANWQIPTLVAIVTAIVIVAGSLYKITWLRFGGGQKVAESLGGVRLHSSTPSFEEQRLLNVVEEMALAAGTPVPPVYLLSDENAINAFAAGYTPSTAVIGVTKGAVRQLTRDQLQGVIAHEFSHILNGDMRMSIRLMGTLHGILLLGLLGRMLFHIFARSGTGSRSSNNKNGGQILIIIIAVGLALILIGAIGSFIGSLIKAAVSRQREYLADASAVQFTRNPSGIAGALKRIGGFNIGSTVKHASAAEVSHMFFAEGVASGFAHWLATHPPLPKRILAIEPNWNRAYITQAPPEESGQPSKSHHQDAANIAAGFASPTQPVSSRQSPAESPLRSDQIKDAVNHVGDPLQQHRDYASKLVQEIPATISDSARDPFGSRAVIFALLLDEDVRIRQTQLAALEQAIEPQVVQLTVQLYQTVAELPARLRLPIIDISMPALLSMTRDQYQTFSASLHALIAADSRLSIFEWGLSQIVVQHLTPNFAHIPEPRIKYYGLQQLGMPISHLLSMICHVGNDLEGSRATFSVGAETLPDVPLEWVPPEQCSLRKLEEDLTLLRQAAYRLRGQLIDACTACICADKEIRPAEAELLRGIAELLDSPMPPILPGLPIGK